MIILILLHSTTPNIVTGTCNLMIFTQCTEMSMLAGLYLTQDTLILELEGCNCFQVHFSKVKKRNFLKQLTHISFRKGLFSCKNNFKQKTLGYYGIYCCAFTVFCCSYSFVPFSL